MGPTASGKTALAVELVQRRNFQIINVDSAQIYRDLNIGSGKPDASTLKIAPHRLIDIKDAAETYSAAEFRSDALVQIEEIIAQGDSPLLVGGTMLYFKVLRDGLADMPHADANVRAEIESLAEEEGWLAVHAELSKVDPDSAKRIHPNDPQRLQRALEVFLVSGKTMTQLHEEEQQADTCGEHSLPYNFVFCAIQPEDRSLLHGQIEARFRQMLNDGLVAEVETLFAREDLSLANPSMKSVGYRQVWQHLAGELSYDEMVERSIIATRQLAKRQLTWLRSWKNLHTLSDPLGNSGVKSIESTLKYVDSISI